AGVWWRTIDISRDDVRLHLIASDLLERSCMEDRVQQRKHPHPPLALSEKRGSQHHPGCGVRILSAVLTNTWHVTLYVSRLEDSAIERRGEQQGGGVAGVNG